MKITISFKETELLSELISLSAPRLKKKKGEFIKFCIERITFNYLPDLWEQYKKGEFDVVELPGDKDE